MVGRVGDEIRAPTALVLDDGKGIVQVSAIAEAAAVALPVAEQRNHVGRIDAGAVIHGN